MALAGGTVLLTRRHGYVWLLANSSLYVELAGSLGW